MNIELEFTFDADYYHSDDERYDWLITGTYTPEQPARINCLPEDAVPFEGSTFEIISVKFDGMEGEPTQADIDDKEAAIMQRADDAAMEGIS